MFSKLVDTVGCKPVTTYGVVRYHGPRTTVDVEHLDS